MEASKFGLLTSVLLVNNVHCPSCVSHAEGVLSPLSDATELAISILTHEIRFQHHQPRTAYQAVQELENAAFEVQHIKTIDNEGKLVNDHETSGERLKRTQLNIWPTSLSRAERKHIENCSACRVMADNRSWRSRTWAAITRRNKSLDVERQDYSARTLDGAAPVSNAEVSEKSSDEEAVHAEWSTVQEIAEYTASLSISGMTCASCSGSITEELEHLGFVTGVNINVLTHSGTVIYHGPKENSTKILESIRECGYDASIDEVKVLSPTDHSVPLPTKYVASMSIEGMSCGSCVGTINEALLALSFVHDSHVDLVGNSGKVTFEGKNNIDRICKRMAELGYEVSVIELKPRDSERAGDEVVSERRITIAVLGMFCEHCPENILSMLDRRFGDSIEVEKSLTLQDPKIRISYTPSLPYLTIRKIVRAICDTHEAFSANIWHPPSIEEKSRAMQHHEQRRILARLIFTFLVAIPTLVIGIVYMSLVPSGNSAKMWFEERAWVGNVSRTEWALFIMTTPVMFFGADIFHTRAFKELRALWRPGSRVPLLRRFYRFGSMNLLISAGTSVAYFSSVAVLILDARATPQHDMESQSMTYFDAVTFLSFFILIGRFLEAYSKARTGDAVAKLSKLRPDEALLIESATEQSSDLKLSDSEVSHVEVDMLEVGDTVKVLYGTSPPTDGVLTSAGTYLFDESSLTGESRPVKKVAGDQIFAGSVNVSQPVHVKVTSIGGKSMLDKIVAVVREGQTKRAPVERVADTITAYFVPVITLLAIITFVVWLGLGLSGALPTRYLKNAQGGWSFWSLEFAIAVFVVACPCGLGLAAPTALFVGGGLAAKNGILVRGGGEAFQEASRLDVIVFDKTGTLTEGQMKVTGYEMLMDEKDSEEKQSLVLALSKVMEESSTHPIAKAITEYCAEEDLIQTKIVNSDITEMPGQGMRGTFIVYQECRGQLEERIYEAAIGNQRLFASLQETTEKAEYTNMYLEATLTKFQTLGQSTAIFYLRDLHHNSKRPSSSFQPIAVFAISDPVRPSAHTVISTLRDRHNLQVHMCTGDNPITALAIASQLGIPASHVRAGVLPIDKAAYIKELQQGPLQPEAEHNPNSTKTNKSKRRNQIVAFIGDGTNDTPALSASDVSIALSSGSDIALSTASFILLSSDLATILVLVALAKRVFARVKYNFAWAAIYNVLLVPVAAGVFFRLGDMGAQEGTGWRFGPVWASAAMALSSLSVVLSSLALRLPAVRSWWWTMARGNKRDGNGKE